MASCPVACGYINGCRECNIPDAIEASGQTHFEGDSCPGGHIQHPGSARFHAILEELGELHNKKQKDYGTDTDPFANVRGSEEWGIEPWVGALLRATDKIRRLQKYAKVGELANEAVEDSFRDLAVYAVIALVLFEEAKLSEEEDV